MKKLFSSDKLYKIFIYVALITLAVSKLKGMKEKSQPHVIEAMTFLFPR